MIFTYEEFHREIERFARELPEALGRDRLTADLAPQVSELLRFDEQLFTVAVVGQMRVGKSSLLNALVDRENLAVTGVEETTATINWFKYGEGEWLEKFRVIWKDKAAEDFPREDILQWVGQSELAARTLCVELFADAPFLKTANLVDTPGTRSLITAHEDATQDFLALKLEEETLRQGHRADAIIYVFPPVARESDEELLTQFGSETRIPGSSAYNSIGVLHKWDGLNDAVAYSSKKAASLSKFMKGRVSTVLPVSAPLHLASLHEVDSFWEPLLRMTIQTNAEDMDYLLDTEADFKEEDAPSCPLSSDDRSNFRREHPIPWVTLRLLLQQGIKDSFGSPEAYRKWARETGGIDRLREELDRRFFSRSRMLRAFGVLHKAREPCYTASTRLENEKRRLDAELEALPAHLEAIDNFGSAKLAPIRQFVKKAEKTARDRFENIAGSHRLIDQLSLRVRTTCDEMRRDVEALEKLEELEAEKIQSGLPEELLGQIRQILGVNGPDVDARTKGLVPEQDGFEIDNAEKLIENLLLLQPTLVPSSASIVECAVDRLEQICHYLETKDKPCQQDAQ